MAWGLGQGLRGLARRLVSVDRIMLYAADLAAITPQASGLAVEFRLGGEDDLDALNAREHDYDGESKAYARRRLADGDLMVLGEHQGGVVFYCWLSLGQVELAMDRFLASTPGTAFVYKVFVVRRQRGQRLFGASHRFILELARELGIHRLLISVHEHNAASQRATLRLGYSPQGVYRLVRVLGVDRFVVPATLRRLIGQG